LKNKIIYRQLKTMTDNGGHKIMNPAPKDTKTVNDSKFLNFNCGYNIL